MVKTQKDFYLNRVVQFQLFQGTKNRESFLKEKDGTLRLRALHLYSMQNLEWHLSSSGFLIKPFDFYSSVATIDWASFPHLPREKFAWKQYRKNFHEIYESLVTGYDFVLDIDHADLKVAWEIARKVKIIFDDFGLPYSLVFSGAKGFHFRLFWEDISPYTSTIQAWVKQCKIIAKSLADAVGFSFGAGQDIDSIYDLKRVIRVPYSLHPKTGNVVLPLTDEQFNNFFKIDFFSWEIFKTVYFKNRGSLKRQFKNNRITEFISKANQNAFKV